MNIDEPIRDANSSCMRPIHWSSTIISLCFLATGCSQGEAPSSAVNRSDLSRIELLGTDEIDYLDGTTANERLVGNQKKDLLTGNGGQDEFVGGPGADGLFGGSDSDTYYFNRGDHGDMLKDLGGSDDQLVFGSGISFEDLVFTEEAMGLCVTVGDINSLDSVFIMEWGLADNFIEAFVVEGKRYFVDEIESSIEGNRRPRAARGIEPQTAIVGKPFRLQIPEGAFIDPDMDELKYNATMHDKSRFPPWLTYHYSNFAVFGTPMEADIGELNILIEASDPGYKTAVIYTKIIVDPAK